MKTAMQEFVERNFYIDTEGEYQLKWTENTPMTDEVNEALKREKIDIKMAYNDGRKNALLKLNKNSEEYYNLTYNQKK
jgi:hypothetical protein